MHGLSVYDKPTSHRKPDIIWLLAILIVMNIFRTLWSDPIIQSQWDRRSEFQLMESVQRYFDRIDVIMSPSYVPDFHDMLYSRMRTSGKTIRAL